MAFSLAAEIRGPRPTALYPIPRNNRARNNEARLYCAVWGNTYIANVESLVMLQKKVIMLLCGAKRLKNMSRLFYNFCILKVPDIVESRTAIIMYAYHNLLPKNVQQLFSR